MQGIININDEKWTIQYQPMIERSYTDFWKKEIVLKSPFDIPHEALHAILHNDFVKYFDKQTEEWLVSFIALKIEKLLLSNNYFIEPLTQMGILK